MKYGIGLGSAIDLVAGRSDSNLMYDYSSCNNAGQLYVNPKRGPSFGYRFEPCPHQEMEWMHFKAGMPSDVYEAALKAQFGKVSKKKVSKKKVSKKKVSPKVKFNKNIKKEIAILEKNMKVLPLGTQKKMKRMIKDLKKVVRLN